MSLLPDECIEYNDKRKICIAVEKGKSYRLNNDSNYTIKKVKVDNVYYNRLEKKGVII